MVIIECLQPERFLDMIGFLLNLIIDIHIAVDDFYCFVGFADQPFDKVFAWVFRVLENHNVPSGRFDELINLF